MKHLHQLLIALCLIIAPIGMTSCAALLPALPAISTVVTDALVILNVIDAAVGDFFRQNPATPAKVQRAYREAFTRAMHALNAAQHAIEGEKKLDQQDYDAAFNAFKQAFIELKALLEQEGLMQNGMLRAGQDESVLIPEPQALTYRVR
jgi:hypothetical protein